MRNRLEALLNGKHKIRGHRQTCHHVLKDQSLVLQLLPLRHSERRPHPCSPTATPTVHFHHHLLYCWMELYYATTTPKSSQIATYRNKPQQLDRTESSAFSLVWSLSLSLSLSVCLRWERGAVSVLKQKPRVTIWSRFIEGSIFNLANYSGKFALLTMLH